MDRGPRTGVTGAVSAPDLDICQGVGADNGCGCCALGPWLWDWRRRWGIVLDAGFKIEVRVP